MAESKPQRRGAAIEMVAVDFKSKLSLPVVTGLELVLVLVLVLILILILLLPLPFVPFDPSGHPLSTEFFWAATIENAI